MPAFLSQPRMAYSLAAVLILALAAPSVTLAQMAPVIGDHYAARESDTGFVGAVNSSGGYGASVPLALPGARGGLAVPVQVALGGHRFGAAGLGGDVPLSFIRHIPDCTNGVCNIAHRRPVSAGDAQPQARDQYSVTLNGSSIDLVPMAQDKWRARGSEQIEVRNLAGGVLELYDGNGLRYSFSSDGGSTGQPLDNGNLYLLTDIFGPAGSKVHLDYAFGAPILAGTRDWGPTTGLSIDLASVKYNYDATGTCWKHQVNLNYGADASAPLSISMLTNTPLVRLHKLKESGEGPAIDVKARQSDPNSQQAPCNDPTMVSLGSYNFTYQNDADTGQSQLSQVTMIGQEGTPERNLTLPVATYTYGQVTGADGKLTYRLTQELLSFPATFNTSFAIASTSNFQNFGSDTFNFGTLQNLIDVDGDGRPDLLYKAPGSFTKTAALNKPNPANPTQSVFTPIDVPDRNASYFQFKFDERGVTTHPRQMDVDGGGNNSKSWVQMIDMNGDGRVDVVVADEVLNAWVVYLNTPDPHDPANRMAWVRREIDIRPLYQNLPGYAGTLAQHPDGIHLPLSSTETGHDQRLFHCWKWDGSNWNESLEGFSSQNPTNRCAIGPQGQDPNRDDFGWIDLSDKTITLWELRDINGDGYPDLVFNASPVGQQDAPNLTPFGPGAFLGQFRETQVDKPFDLPPSTQVKALLNVAGVHLATGIDRVTSDGDVTLNSGTSAFSAPITLDIGCGVSRWTSDIDAMGRSATTQVCGFEDINGDGLVDRLGNATVSSPLGDVLVNVARLGTGNPNAPFSNAVIQLPGPAARSQSDLVATGQGHYRPAACPEQQSGASSFPYPTSTYPIRRTHGFRDINGDRIPDYLAWDVNSGWTVALGTGVGFAAPKTIDIDDTLFDLSREIVGCFPDNTTSGTVAGLYDLYGEGQPAFVELHDNALNVFRLNTSIGSDGSLVANPPTSGLITRIANGYGAFTDIRYRSAKEDASTNHLLPNPEVVVTAVTTQDGSGQPLSPMLYAYGDASRYFDAASDRWVFPGYRRKVRLQNTGDPINPGAGTAIISDSYPLADFDSAMDATARFLRYAKAGRTRDVTTLSGDDAAVRNVGADPWALLTVDVTSDARRIAASHMDHTARLLPAGSNAAGSNSPQFCVDMVKPHDYNFSLSYSNNTQDSVDQCAERGFALQTSVTSYRGTPATTEVGTADMIASPSIVKTSSVITAYDDFGRVTDSTSHGDLADPGTDLCGHVEYATPTPNLTVRVLNAPAQQTVQDCHGVTLAANRYEYDGLTDDSAGQVTNGFLTSSTVTRYDGDTHASLGDIRLFDAILDPITGNPTTISKTRDDNARTGTNFSYDPFGLVLTRKDVWSTGSNFDTLFTIFTPDPVTLNVTSMTDTNGTVRSTAYDGFGRVLLSKVTPPGGTEGILSSLSYNGFELVDTNGDGVPDSTIGPRSITQKAFTDAVTDVTAPGRTGATTLDSLGRSETQVQLGADYQNKTIVLDRKIYDALGRAKFIADPFLSTDNFATAYGTSYNYNTDGTPNCFVRGPGVRPGNASLDETNEIYPTCFLRGFSHNQEILTRIDPDPQLQPYKETTLNALGRVLQGRVFIHASHGGRGVAAPRSTIGVRCSATMRWVT